MSARSQASVLSRLLMIGGLLFLVAVQPAAAQGRRVALVVGNGGYLAVRQLANPPNDANLLANTLKRLGFELIGGGAQTDLDKAGFDRAVRSFGQTIAGAEVALFYYAGHGMQVQGTNWLVPVDANPSQIRDLEYQMFDASAVLKQMEAAKTKLNIMILDACRDNPFRWLGSGNGETGLAQMRPAPSRGRQNLRGSEPGLAQMHVPEGTVIGFATQPGNTARDGSGADSPYTLALDGAMRQPGLNVLSMFNRVGVEVKRATNGAQQPWVSNSPIEGEYFFAGPAADTVATAARALPRLAVPGSVSPGMAPMPDLPRSASGAISAGLFKRVLVKGEAANIAVPPSIDFVDPAADVPQEFVRFVGAWGPGQLAGSPDDIIIAVTSIDAMGNARLLLMRGPSCSNPGCGTPRQSAVLQLPAKMENGHLSFTSPFNRYRVALEIGQDGRLHGTTISRGNKASAVQLPLIGCMRCEARVL